jgi:hypothetical protein
MCCVVTLAMNQDAFEQASLDITLKQGTPEEARTRDLREDERQPQ